VLDAAPAGKVCSSTMSDSQKEALLDLIRRQSSNLAHARKALEEAERTLLYGMARARGAGAPVSAIAQSAGMDVWRVADLVAERPDNSPSRNGTEYAEHGEETASQPRVTSADRYGPGEARTEITLNDRPDR
jgi:hypothetical protein